MRLLATLALGISLIAQEKPALRIVVIQGEDAVNVIQQKTAVAPLVEVRDRNDQPVAGVPVTFTVADATTGGFAGGSRTITVTTNNAGRAAANGLRPIKSGSLRIDVSATYQGQTASTAINQTNAAGGGSGKTWLTLGLIAGAVGGGAAAVLGAQNSETSGAGTTGSGSSSSTPPATTTTPPTTTPAPPSNRPPVVSAIVAAPATTIVGLPITFSAPASDPEGDALTLTWDFGDGSATSAQTSPTHIYERGGQFVVRLTVRDRESAASAELPFSPRSLTGRWDLLDTPDDGGDLTITQHGPSSFSGTMLITLGTPRTAQTECPITGTITPSSPQLRFTRQVCFLPTRGDAEGFSYIAAVSEDADTISDTRLPNIRWKRR